MSGRRHPGAGGDPQDAARGATLVEYAVMISLIVIGLIGGLSYIQDGATDKLENRGDSIGHPTEPGLTTTTTSSSGTTSSTSATSSTIPNYVGRVDADCNSGPEKNVCTFVLNPAPAAGATVTWSIDPASGYTGLPPGPTTFTATGTRTVRALVDTTLVQRTLTCTANGSGKITCVQGPT